jgi:hypothetical protein
MSFTEIIAVYCGNHTEHSLWQNPEFINITADRLHARMHAHTTGLQRVKSYPNTHLIVTMVLEAQSTNINPLSLKQQPVSPSTFFRWCVQPSVKEGMPHVSHLQKPLLKMINYIFNFPTFTLYSALMGPPI